MADAPRLYISIYTDEDVTIELARAVRERGFSAQSAAEAGLLNADDSVHLASAAENGMALLTFNARDYLRLAKKYAEANQSHAGIIISSEQYSRKRLGEILRLINSFTADEMRDRVVYLQNF